MLVLHMQRLPPAMLVLQGKSYPSQLLSTCPASGAGLGAADALRVNLEAAK